MFELNRTVMDILCIEEGNKRVAQHRIDQAKREIISELPGEILGLSVEELEAILAVLPDLIAAKRI